MFDEDERPTSRWTGRPDKDYVPPGGMRKFEGGEDEKPVVRRETAKVAEAVQTVEVRELVPGVPVPTEDKAGTKEDPLGFGVLLGYEDAGGSKRVVERKPDEGRSSAAKKITKKPSQPTKISKSRDRTPAALAPRFTCPVCGSKKLKCQDTRPTGRGRVRTYRCLEEGCSGHLHTRELPI
jgi:predicted RNA-binding Zn-ribbon protein involved in translation (DUF1610 family)